MTRPGLLALGVLAMLLAWTGPLTIVLGHSFTAHMAMHMTVVAIAAPLMAIGLAGSRFDPSALKPALFAPVIASLIELAVVWAWHAPALHSLARSTAWGVALEQTSFLAAGLLVWLAAFGGREHARDRRGAGVIGLLLTSMHMTLLGALLGLSSRPLYPHVHHDGAGLGLSPLDDQHLGGALMLLAGGTVYLLGGLVLIARLLRDDPSPAREER